MRLQLLLDTIRTEAAAKGGLKTANQSNSNWSVLNVKYADGTQNSYYCNKAVFHGTEKDQFGTPAQLLCKETVETLRAEFGLKGPDTSETTASNLGLRQVP